jgi:hypothetical protein
MKSNREHEIRSVELGVWNKEYKIELGAWNQEHGIKLGALN